MRARARRFWLGPVAVSIAAGAVLAAGGSPAAPRDGEPLSIVATVVTKKGFLSADLTKEDFEVFDNGKRQPVTVFKSEAGPIALVILVDRSGSLVWDPAVVWRAAERLVSTAVMPGDRVRAGTFSSKVLIAPPGFATDREEILKALHESIQGAGWTPLWNAATAGIEALSAEPGRRVLLIVSENKDTPDKAGVNSSLADVRARALSGGVAVFAIGLSGKQTHELAPPMSQGQGGRGGGGSRGGATATQGTPGAEGSADPGLKILTEESGGDFFEFDPGFPLPESFSFIADELHHRYVLGFTPAADGKVHTLDVRVKRSGLTVKARKSYVAAAGK